MNNEDLTFIDGFIVFVDRRMEEWWIYKKYKDYIKINL